MRFHDYVHHQKHNNWNKKTKFNSWKLQKRHKFFLLLSHHFSFDKNEGKFLFRSGMRPYIKMSFLNVAHGWIWEINWYPQAWARKKSAYNSFLWWSFIFNNLLCADDHNVDIQTHISTMCLILWIHNLSEAMKRDWL